jgi:cysteine desulfurase
MKRRSTLPIIYLDNNATTRPSDAVVAAVTRANLEFWQNPSSVHRAGQAARQQVELARASLAELIGARARELTLTSGGTEAIDLAIRGVLGAMPRERRPLVTTRTEHAAVRDVAEELEKSGEAQVRWAPVGRDGLVDPAAISAALGGAAGLVSVQWANNETGAVQPVREILDICRRSGAVFHCDGTQWVGKEPAAAEEACDVLTFAPHKFHGPKGVGVLWARPGVRIRPRLLGTQELGRRGGTENVTGIVGAGVAAEEALEWLRDGEQRGALAALRDRFEAQVLAACPGAAVNGARQQRLWNTTNIGFPRLEAEALLMLLSERGVCASAGAACSSGSLDPSPVLLAMGVPPELAHGSVRFSLSKQTTGAELEEAARIVSECVGVLARSSPG